MNTRRIIIAGAVLVSVSTFVAIYLVSENNIAQQNQAEQLLSRVHEFTDNGTKYVKIGDLTPNSAFTFKYPYTENSTQSYYNTWILIRLSSKYGGDKNDISSFRAYSTMGITPVDCILNYKAKLERLDDVCHDSMYEPVNGTAVAGPALQQSQYNKTLPNALPKLDLGIDDQGYIYVKPPTFDIDKNGVIGLGRKIS